MRAVDLIFEYIQGGNVPDAQAQEHYPNLK
jgi:hypothetical protein